MGIQKPGRFRLTARQMWELTVQNFVTIGGPAIPAHWEDVDADPLGGAPTAFAI